MSWISKIKDSKIHVYNVFRKIVLKVDYIFILIRQIKIIFLMKGNGFIIQNWDKKYNVTATVIIGKYNKSVAVCYDWFNKKVYILKTIFIL